RRCRGVDRGPGGRRAGTGQPDRLGVAAPAPRPAEPRGRPMTGSPELICPAGTPATLRAAVDAGADAVYCGFQNATNARNFSGLNFTPDEMQAAVGYAHARGAKVLLALN